jgi:hypothetical protein
MQPECLSDYGVQKRQLVEGGELFLAQRLIA